MSDTNEDTGARPWHGTDNPFEAFYQWLVGLGVVSHFKAEEAAVEADAAKVEADAEPVVTEVEKALPVADIEGALGGEHHD